MNTADFKLNFSSVTGEDAELIAVSARGLVRLGEALGAGAVSCKLPPMEAYKAEKTLSSEGFAVNIWVPLISPLPA